jgi:3-phenylpropionate/trans-cinnamate dioxygenase ferredoxin reductase subunit
LPVAPELAGAVHVLRDLADAEALRAKLMPGAHLAIVGGGFVGLEVAASARALGAEATLIEILPRLLSRCVPPRIAASLERRHAAAGVEVILGRSIEQIAPAAGGSIQLDDGRVIEADAVTACSGFNPGRTPRSKALAPRATCWAPASVARACPGSGRTSTSSRSRWRASPSSARAQSSAPR